MSEKEKKMMNLAVKNGKVEENTFAEIIQRMSSDNEFCGNLINAKNLNSFLESTGFLLNQQELNILNASVKKIKDMVNDEVKTLTGQLFELVTNLSGCNGTGW